MVRDEPPPVALVPPAVAAEPVSADGDVDWVRRSEIPFEERLKFHPDRVGAGAGAGAGAAGALEEVSVFCGAVGESCGGKLAGGLKKGGSRS